MTRFLYFIIALSWPVSYSHAIQWPFVSNPRIESCIYIPVLPYCSYYVRYTHSGTIMNEIGMPISKPKGDLRILAYGIHCVEGDVTQGIPYENCSWSADGVHSPYVTGPCNLRTQGEWELDNNSTCKTTSSWGPHSGASPGGECVLFGQLDAGWLNTPLGLLHPTVVANSGNAYCVKPLPPNVKCEISLPSEIDHGVISEGEAGFSRRFIDGAVDCGGNPVVAVIGRSDIELATGVSVKVSASMMSNTQLRVQSDMDIKSNAAPGEYFASVVIAVSPY